MNIEARSVMDQFGERMKRLAIYEPLHRLDRKKGKDRSGKEIPYYELGMLTLLFFFENMIMRQKTSGVRELAIFLQEVCQEKIDLEGSGFEDLAREITEVYRPSNGKRNSRTFYNWETGQDETVYYSILKAARSDLKSNVQYYTLDEQGLELIFSTREYFSEFQISINQLLLRKQLEKGEFVGSLRQLDEMSLAAETLTERLEKIKNEVSRSIVSEETYTRYKKLIEDINLRLVRENEEFEELHEFVRLTKDSLKYQLDNAKDKKAYDLILKIDNRLEEVHHEHSRLLQESISLRTHALDAAQQALYYIGIDSFNFEQEIVDALMGRPMPLHTSSTFMEPFLSLERAKVWHPLSVFYKQRIERVGEEDKGRAFVEGATEEEVRKSKSSLGEFFKEVMTCLMPLFEEQAVVTLEEVCDYVEANRPEWLERRLFYDLWIILHQKSPLTFEALDEDSVMSGVKEALGGITDRIKVVEYSGTVQKVPRFEIQNMLIDITMERQEGESHEL
ncbi:MAG: replicative DNA helicase [Cellulosilyticaceae bacterium]